MTLPLTILKPENAGAVLADAFVTLDAAMPGPADQPPALLLAVPPAWNNRYQALLYGQGAPHRYAVLGISTLEMLDKISWPGPIVLHAHWFAGMFGNCATESDAEAQVGRITARLSDFRARTGARLVWTAHNVFPHGNRFAQAFLLLRQWLFDNLDAVHVMQDEHIAVLEREFGRPAPRHFTVPHMLYQGSQPDCITPEAARLHYGLAPDSFVFGYFGSIHPYKQLDSFLSAFDRVAADSPRPLAALVGGVPSDPATVQMLEQRWGDDRRVRLQMRTIPDHEIQYMHRAADIMVLPYGETLNSGAAYMAASFERPIIMPDGLASRVLAGLGVTIFDSADSGALESALRRAVGGERGTDDPQIRARFAPIAVSNSFFEALDGLVGRK